MPHALAEITPDDHHNQRHGDEDHTRVVVVGGVTPTTIQPDDTAAAGSSTTGAAADHRHAIVTDPAGTSLPGDSAIEGTATSFARSDHKHGRESVSGATVAAGQTTTSTSYTDLATSGPAVTLTTGTAALVTAGCQYYNATAARGALMAFAVSGATTRAASDAEAAGILGSGVPSTCAVKGSRTTYITGLTAGSNTFTAKYRADVGGTANFSDRDIIVERVN